MYQRLKAIIAKIINEIVASKITLGSGRL